MLKKLLSHLVAFGTPLLFLIYKFSHLLFRFGDGNAYLYMARSLLSGQLPYRDFFLADPPALVLFLTPFVAIFKNHLLWLQMLPSILESGTATLLYLFLRRRENPLAFLAPAIYLFAFSTLATSDYLSGVQLVIFASVLAIFLHDRGSNFWSGVAWGIAAMAKLYALPAIVGFLIYLAIRRDWRTVTRVVLGTTAAATVLMGPFLLISFDKVWQYMVIHQFHRPPGNAKAAVWGFLFAKEWFLLIAAVFGGFVSGKRRWALILPLGLTALFFLLFQDLYYLYLDNMIAYLAILAVIFLGYLWGRAGTKKIAAMLVLFYAVFLFAGFADYQSNFLTRGRFENAPEVAALVKTMPDGKYLYGSHEVAPLVALLADRSLLPGYIDTNAQAFGSGAQDRELASRLLVENGGFLIARITDLPDLGIRDAGYEGLFNQDIFKNVCRRAAVFPSTSRESDNFLVLYHCVLR